MNIIIHNFISRLFNLPIFAKLTIKISLDLLSIFTSFLFAMALAHGNINYLNDRSTYIVTMIVGILSIISFMNIGFYRQITRFINSETLKKLTFGIILSFLLVSIASIAFHSKIPWTVPIIYGFIIWFCICGSRYVFKVLYRSRSFQDRKKILIFGAGEAGLQLINSLKLDNEYQTVGLLDDNIKLQGTEVAGISVYAPSKLNDLIAQKKVCSILLAMPSISLTKRRKIIHQLAEFSIDIKTMPSLAKIISGESSVNDMRQISIDDLLSRDPVPAQNNLMKQNILDKKILVTGAGGSIGSELCRQIIEQDPSTLVILDSSEFALYQVEEKLIQFRKEKNLNAKIVTILGSIMDYTILKKAIHNNHVQTIYHAAAYKHVPMVEKNLIEGIKNNVFGTLNLVKAAIDANVESFTLISSDKAVRPTNIMGASKRLSELICQAYSQEQEKTIFSMVRFGNVLDSSGSVVPYFKEQIRNGGPVTVTHPAITRFFMTVSEAAQLVIQAGGMSNGGDVFILDMGEPIKITELAEKMIKLSGLEPYYVDANAIKSDNKGDIEITFTSLRDGEKLFEELLIGKNSKKTIHPKIFTATEVALDHKELQIFLDMLLEACNSIDEKKIKELLLKAPIQYSPQ